jgi:hypothetical protein
MQDHFPRRRAARAVVIGRATSFIVRHPRAAEKPSGRRQWSSCRRSAGVPAAPFFQQIDFHGQLIDLALQFGDLTVVFGDAVCVGDLVGDLASFVFSHPLAEQIADRLCLRDSSRGPNRFPRKSRTTCSLNPG